jgi:hypothetical protein
MAGAPTNTHAAASTLEIIRACLTTGFNPRSVVSASVASGVMTINYAAPHGYEDRVWLRLDGAAGGSIVQRVTTAAGASSLTIPAPGFADGAVAGALSTRVAPADWEEVFTDTGIGVFRSKVIGPGSTRFFYRVADTVSGSSARVRGFESMSDANTGLGPYPAIDGTQGAQILRATSSAISHWAAVADGRTMYLAMGRTTPETWCAHFGDEAPFSASDLFCASVGAGFSGQLSQVTVSATIRPRPANGIGTAQGARKNAPFGDSGASGRAYPSPVDGGMVFARPIMGMDGSSTSSAIRSVFRGLMHCSARPMAGTWTVLPTVDGVTGRVLVVRDAGTADCVAFPIDEDWA